MTVKTYSLTKEGETKLSANFKVKEFASKDGADEILIDTDLVDILQHIRKHFGKPIEINSGYRSPAHNKAVGGGSQSYHVKGQAADIVVRGVGVDEVAKYAEMLGVLGIGLYEKSSFVHVDTRQKKYYWFNNEREIATNSFGVKPYAEAVKERFLLNDSTMEFFKGHPYYYSLIEKLATRK